MITANVKPFLMIVQDPRFEEFLYHKKLQKREIDETHSSANEKGACDISNAVRLGKTEVSIELFSQNSLLLLMV